ncbi:MAG TPA: hypothetical protein VG817_11725 [Gemmatimonadales bacterium]|nr:hypothetical protein [Gemmatimonadales bacterium]
MIRCFVLGLVLTAVVTGLLWAGFGQAAIVPGVTFGLLSTAIQLLALRHLKARWAGSNREFLEGVGIGMALRVLGIVLMLVAIVVDRGRFPPLPTAFGFLGVLIPLLFLEVRFAR